MKRHDKQLTRLLHDYAGQAREIEMNAALGALAAQFDQWKAGTISPDDLNAAVHAYHNGIAREIWKRYDDVHAKEAVIGAVARGVLPLESLPPAVAACVGERARARQEIWR